MEQLSLRKKLIWLTIFSIAMGFLESAVVVYLRFIYYPDGFDFPLKPIHENLVLTELLREFATILMLIGIGVVASKKNVERFAYFIFCFAIWDIFYYVFLKLLLDWPNSLLTWDVLFLIPVTWVGPVIAPIIVSLTMILLTGVIIWYSRQLNNFHLQKREWWLLIMGSLVVIISFVADYTGFILTHYCIDKIWSMQDGELFALSIPYIPVYFNWWIFGAGQFLLFASIWRIHWRNKRLMCTTI